MTTDIVQTAPEGQIWMCAACGKTNKDRDKVGDEACWIWARLVDETTIVRNHKGQAVSATVVPPK